MKTPENVPALVHIPLKASLCIPQCATPPHRLHCHPSLPSCELYFHPSLHTVHCALHAVTNLQTAWAWLRSNLATHKGLKLWNTLWYHQGRPNTQTPVHRWWCLKRWKDERTLELNAIMILMRIEMAAWWCILWISRPLLFASVSHNALTPHPHPSPLISVIIINNASPEQMIITHFKIVTMVIVVILLRSVQIFKQTSIWIISFSDWRFGHPSKVWYDVWHMFYFDIVVLLYNMQ